MSIESALGAIPIVDNQGDREVCVKAATSKAVVAGLEYCKWTGYRFDANQQFILGSLHGDKLDILSSINPCQLNGRYLKIKDEETQKWSEFLLEIIAMTKAEFGVTWNCKSKEFLVGYQGHCLYVEEIDLDGKRLLCLNSWGDKRDPRPTLLTESLEDYMLFSVELVLKPAPEDLEVASNLCSQGELYSPSVEKLDLLSRAARWGKMQNFDWISLSGNIGLVEPVGISKLSSKARVLLMLPDLVLSKDQWMELVKRCKDYEWEVNELDVRCVCDVQTMAWMTMMTKTVFINIDECQFSYEDMGATMSAIQHSYSCWCAEIGFKSVCMNKMLSCATEINKYLRWSLVEKARSGFITLKKI